MAWRKRKRVRRQNGMPFFFAAATHRNFDDQRAALGANDLLDARNRRLEQRNALIFVERRAPHDVARRREQLDLRPKRARHVSAPRDDRRDARHALICMSAVCTATPAVNASLIASMPS